MLRRALLAFALVLLLVSGLVSGARASENTPRKEAAFFPLGDFTLNLSRDGWRNGYIVVDLTIEARPEATAALKAILPRLRQAVLMKLMDMRERGEIQSGNTDARALKDKMLAAVSKLQSESVRAVVITRILYT